MRRVMLAGLAALLLGAVPATAQAPIPNKAIVRAADGSVYVVVDAVLVPLAVRAITDEQVRQYTISPVWVVLEDGVAIPGPKPDWAAPPLVAQTASASAPPTSGAWVPVAEFSGNGSRTTPPVVVTASRWRAVWTVAATSGGHAQLCLSATNIQTGRLGLSGCTDGPGENYSYAGPGEYALKVSGVNAGWTVRIEQQT